jgi:hypothetical protein
MWQVTYVALLSWLKWLEVAPASAPYDGPLANVWVGLFVAPTPAILPSSTMANITEASYDGYVRQEVAWLPEIVSSGGNVTKKGQNMLFAPIDGTVPNTITGAFLATALTGGSLIAGAAAPAPIFLGAPPSGLFIVPVLQLPSTPVYGAPEWNF